MMLGADLERRRNPDGGFGAVVGSGSEPEPTALVALGFDDETARRWLRSVQEEDGGVGLRVGGVRRDVTPLAALAFGPGAERERALDRVDGSEGRNGPDPAVSAFGWPWTDGTHGWTEPTAWGLLALRQFRPTAGERIADALALFRERECVGGGWNYGSRVVLGVELLPYVQTTALGILALGSSAVDLSRRGVQRLESSWRSEAAGLLTLATACAAMRAARSGQAATAVSQLRSEPIIEAEDNVVFAWAQLALGDVDPWGHG